MQAHSGKNSDASLRESTLPDINQDFSGWYNEIVFKADLADQAPVRGCIVIKPYGYALWEQIQKVLDGKIKATGHVNAQFPLLIPMSFLEREAEHVKGFSPELAVVTHAGGKELEEPLVVRPTSETIIHYMFARWLRSWRDLPLKINQWANVVRWEMRSRPFLRTTEFWWQEGHTAHETQEEAAQEVQTMLLEYVDLAENYLAVPVVAGQKSATERFAGADATFTIEGLMPDGKALQMGTSHAISQDFAKAFAMTFQDRQGNIAYPFLTSWGATTRLIGALIMTHGDQKGLIMPPRVAPHQVVLIPIFGKHVAADILKNEIQAIAQELRKADIRVIIDADEHTTPGAKFYQWELKGVPLRLELGGRDMASQSVTLVDRLSGVKDMVGREGLAGTIQAKLEHIQAVLFQRARERRAQRWFVAEKLADFGPQLDNHPGFYQTGWCQRESCELAFKEYKATTRCLLPEKQLLYCSVCGQESPQDVLVARAY